MHTSFLWALYCLTDKVLHLISVHKNLVITVSIQIKIVFRKEVLLSINHSALRLPIKLFFKYYAFLVVKGFDFEAIIIIVAFIRGQVMCLCCQYVFCKK